ncbi:DNA-binding NarL/FixJ family response regulator [Luteibacter jiangsuensis]|uniref:DNA-binding NarL/FixJ family response regulator n=1 Tax=Luteibacter jiangsuensis TaxID=637577 RepID=A0ABT9SVK8_9GAMM|nr:response regulator transcription factor [Luteibacter jiangsuensis]MDQ0008421.1 DNA-binding NarL/FixJ family response regulator [Luteibacter jiangsuensis]
MTASSLRILVADDDPLFRAGVVAMLAANPAVTVVGEAGSGTEAIEVFRALRPDIVLVDPMRPDMDGDRVIAALRTIDPAARIIVLTTHPGDGTARRALAAGAQGYLLKASLTGDLASTVLGVHAGEYRISAEVAQRLSEHRDDEALTERELEVLRGVAAGLENKQIAKRLGLSADTVKEYVSNAMAKLHASNRAHALSIALARGFLR